MWKRRNNFTDERLSAEVLSRHVGLSVTWYFGVLVALSVVLYFVTDRFVLDFTYLLLFWMAAAIRDGHATGCKWGIFTMVWYGVICLAFCFTLLLRPGYLESHNHLPAAGRPWYFILSLVYVFWSIVNLKYLLQVLRLKRERFWTGRTIAGCVTAGLLMAFMLVLAAQDMFGSSKESRELGSIGQPVEVGSE